MVLFWLLTCLLSAALAQQQRGNWCGNGRIGNGICSDPTLCCSATGFCQAQQRCHNVARATETLSNPTPSPASSSSSVAPSVITVKTEAPSEAPYTLMPATPFPTAVYSNCDGLSDVMTVNFGYYLSSAASRDPSCNKLAPGDIDVAGAGYTHLGYAFAGIDANDTLVPYGSKFETEVPLYREFNGLKKKHPNLKTIISIGGWTFNNEEQPTHTTFHDIASSPTRSANFALSVVVFLEKYGFDGIDIDWEFPGRPDRGGNTTDYVYLPLLVKAIRDAYNAAGKGEYIISLSTPPAQFALDIGFDMKALSQHLDFFTVLAYEIHGLWDVPKVVASNTYLPFIQTAVEYMLTLVPSNKLVFGLAAYGHSYTLADPGCIHAGCPFTGAGTGGCAGDAGIIPYFTIDEFIKSGSYDYINFVDGAKTMEMSVNKTTYISYDNQDTWNIRAEYAVEKCLRGYFWWAIDQLAGPVPLTPRAGPKPIPPTPSPTSTSTSPVPTTSPANPGPTITPTSQDSTNTPINTTPPSPPSASNPTSAPITSPTSNPSSWPVTSNPSFWPVASDPTITPTAKVPTTISSPTSKPTAKVPTSTSSPTSKPTLKPTVVVPTSKPTTITNITFTFVPTSVATIGSKAESLKSPTSDASLGVWQSGIVKSLATSVAAIAVVLFLV